jgi:hypothetical protein
MLYHSAREMDKHKMTMHAIILHVHTTLKYRVILTLIILFTLRDKLIPDSSDGVVFLEKKSETFFDKT